MALAACAPQTSAPQPEWQQDWWTRFEAGREAYSHGDTATAEHELRAALAVARAEDPPGMAAALSLNALATLLVNTGRPEEAKPSLAEAMGIFESRVGTENQYFALVLNTRGDLAMKEGRYGDAEADFQRALAITERLKPVPEDLRVRTRTMLVGSICLQGRVAEGDAIGQPFGMKCRRAKEGTPHPAGGS